MAWGIASRKPEAAHPGVLRLRCNAPRGADENNRAVWPLLDQTQLDHSPESRDALPALVPDRNAGGDSAAPGWQRPFGWLRRAGQFFFTLSFSSLTRRIVSLNLAGLVALVASILYLSQFRAGLIDARAQSLLVQAEIIAGAIAASATVEGGTITL